jgi:hypothetical protein
MLTTRPPKNEFADGAYARTLPHRDPGQRDQGPRASTTELISDAKVPGDPLLQYVPRVDAERALTSRATLTPKPARRACSRQPERQSGLAVAPAKRAV